MGEVERTVAAIAAHPQAGVVVRGDIRRRLLRRFPFALFYSINTEEILSIAVMDLRRDPEYWVGRL